MTGAQKATRALGQGEAAIFDLNGRVCLAAQLTYSLNDFGDAPTIGWMVVAQSTSFGIEGQSAHTGNQVAVSDKLSAFALRTKAQIFVLHDDSDGETVID